MVQEVKVFTKKDQKINLGGLSEKGIDKILNQDAFKIGQDEQNELVYIIVADGLGSCKKSDEGARRITEIIEDWILHKLPNYSYLSDNVANIMAKRIVEEWNDSFDLNEIYDYDTTVHVAVCYKGSILIGGIGDGMALVKYDDLVCKDYIDDKNLFSNVTNSMCSINIQELLNFEIIQNEDYKEDAIIILATDGIADDLIPEKKLTLPAYFEEVITESNVETLQDELEEWIADWETESHSDDKTLCYLMVKKEK